MLTVSAHCHSSFKQPVIPSTLRIHGVKVLVHHGKEKVCIAQRSGHICVDITAVNAHKRGGVRYGVCGAAQWWLPHMQGGSRTSVFKIHNSVSLAFALCTGTS